jgi:hypothetical protein
MGDGDLVPRGGESLRDGKPDAAIAAGYQH